MRTDTLSYWHIGLRVSLLQDNSQYLLTILPVKSNKHFLSPNQAVGCCLQIAQKLFGTDCKYEKYFVSLGVVIMLGLICKTVSE